MLNLSGLVNNKGKVKDLKVIAANESISKKKAKD
jgi:hypothetical protein